MYALLEVGGHGCSVPCARSTQQFSGKEEENNMKRTNGATAAVGALLFRALQAGFGYAVVFNTLKEAYSCPSIVFAAAVWPLLLRCANTLS